MSNNLIIGIIEINGYNGINSFDKDIRRSAIMSIMGSWFNSLTRSQVMINHIPKQFEFNEKTSNLFLFYQCITELIFDFSPDSYKVTSFNTHTLCVELYNIYMFLKNDNSLERFYDQYIPDIIEEVLYNIHNDDIAKKLIGKRLEKYISILEQCINSEKVDDKIKIFETNIRNLLHFFDNKSYYSSIVQRLEECICGSKNQSEIINLTNLFVSELIYLGYSKQHIHNVVNEWFKQKINDTNTVHNFFEQFNFKNIKWDIITFVNSKLNDYYCSDLKDIISTESIQIQDFTNKELALVIEADSDYKWIKTTLESLNNISYNVSLIKATIDSYDPYTAYENLMKFLRTINNLITMFDNELKTSYFRIACLNYQLKKTIVVKRPMEKRLRYSGQNYSKRTASVLKKLNMSNRMFKTFLKMLSFHGDALGQDVESKYILLMLWTSLESLFIDNNDKAHKSTLVKNSLIEIIQRTYIIKIIKYLHYDFLVHLRSTNKDLISKYKLDDIDVFIELLFDDNSECMSEVCATLERNPLLRSRIYQSVSRYLQSADLVNKSLIQHRKKITWQILRIYRTRNLIVHSGISTPYIDDLVEHLHNYLDFIINYIVCKVENNEAISDISDIVSEVKIDNELHISLLSKYKGKKTKENIYEILFGASNNVVDYYRNSIV